MDTDSQDLEERRGTGQDRRSRERMGKYERRKNRCGSCLFFVHEENHGFCQKHSIRLESDTFACPLFQEVMT